jgi:hypothetical protein
MEIEENLVSYTITTSIFQQKLNISRDIFAYIPVQARDLYYIKVC